MGLNAISSENPLVTGDQYIVDYNASGNPVDMLLISNFRYSQVEYHFRYDRFHRLTD